MLHSSHLLRAAAAVPAVRTLTVLGYEACYVIYLVYNRQVLQY
jgi:hypothetical protein